MFKKICSNFLIILFFTVFSVQIAYAINDASTDGGEAQDQQSFPFDKQCLNYDEANFKVGQPLLDVMTAGDFPQYCVLYSLSKYQVKQKMVDGYFITGPKTDLQHAEMTTVFLKSKVSHQQNQILVSSTSSVSKLNGQWAYFVGPEEFAQDKGNEKEVYVFQEIDF